jgi:SAM-dependent methyltransferase
MTDPKQGEREYFARIGEDGRAHAVRKPFSDEHCAEYMANVAAFMALIRPPPARIVEFGCGTGWLGLMFAARGYELIGVDISPEAIAMAEQLRDTRQIKTATYRVADYEDVRIDPPADYILFHDALHHAESELAALRAAHAALAPGGMVLCLEPGEGHSRVASSRRAIEEFGVHEKDMPPRHIIETARAAGFRRHVVLPWPWFHVRSVYRPVYGSTRGIADLRGRKWLSLLRVVRYFFRTRRQGLVVLFKE